MSVLDVGNVETAQGGNEEGSSASEKGLIKELQASREKIRQQDSKAQQRETKIAELTGKVDVLSQKTPKQYTRVELQAHVDDGRVSQDEADRILNDQTESNIEGRVSAKLEAANKVSVRANMVSEEISKYTAAKPGVMAAGSDERTMVETQYQHLLTMGKPEGPETELDALRTVFGPSANLQNARSKDPETHQDIGGDGGETPAAEGKAPKGLSADAKKYYARQIENGMYEDWDAVTKELENASSGPKRRLGVA